MEIDPEGTEMRAVSRLTSLRGKEVLEVGCGDGRMTFKFAGGAARVVAVDPSRGSIAAAKQRTPHNLAGRVSFRVGRGEELPFDDGSFDLVFMTHSLCCTDVPAQERVLMEAWRVLRDGGELMTVMDSLHQPLYSGMLTYLLKRGSGQPDWCEPERQARLALRHMCYVERRFRFVAEKEFPLCYYYDSQRELMKNVKKESGMPGERLEKERKGAIDELVASLKSRKGIRLESNQVLTLLRKRSLPRP